MAPATRILLVEDEPLLGQNIACFLRREFAEVHLARDAERAMAVLNWFTPEMAVVDYGLPGMNGAQLYRAMTRTAPRRIGCVMITGYPPEHVAPMAALHDIEHVLAKPFSLETLGRLIRNSCGD